MSGSHESVQERSKSAQKCTKFYKNSQKPSKTCVYLWLKNKERVFIRVYSWFHLKKQTQFLNHGEHINPCTKIGYDDLLVLGGQENKANQSQFQNLTKRGFCRKG